MAMNNMNQLLLDSGISYLEATAAIPFLYFSPNSSDPDMTPVKIIIRAIQTQLNHNGGLHLAVDGVMGAQTATALRAVVPANIVVGTTKWYDLLSYAMKNKPAQVAGAGAASTTLIPTGGFTIAGVDLTNPWVIGGALALLYMVTQSKKRRR
jgi:hypothetical protein